MFENDEFEICGWVKDSNWSGNQSQVIISNKQDAIVQQLSPNDELKLIQRKIDKV